MQLFSIPQQMVASNTSNEPQEKVSVEKSSTERMELANVTRKIASQSRLETASRKSRSAMREVATISKLLSSEALEEVV